MSHAIMMPETAVAYKNFLTLHGSHKIVKAKVTEDSVEIIRQYPSNASQGNGEPMPDQVFKEVYVVRDGKIVLDRQVQGKHTPAHTVRESITFSE